MPDDLPLIVDLYSGEGGAGWGYGLAGFRVLGVDLKRSRRYPFPSVQADVLTFLASLSAAQLSRIAAFHASPPCPDRSHGTPVELRGTRPRMIGATRAALIATGRPWIIEGVPGTKGSEPLRADIVLCGCMFGLKADGKYLARTRHFETSWGAFDLRAPCSHRGKAVTIGRHGGRIDPSRAERRSEGAHRPRHIPLAEAKALMGIEWMSERGLGNSLPPVYTHYMGELLHEHLREQAA